MLLLEIGQPNTRRKYGLTPIDAATRRPIIFWAVLYDRALSLHLGLFVFVVDVAAGQASASDC